jgi:hypothetical protein
MIGKGIFIARRILVPWLFIQTVSSVAAFSLTTAPAAGTGLLLQQQKHVQSSRSHGLSLLARLGSDEDTKEEEEKKQSSNPFRFFLHPYESKIPNELRDEIMQAEAQTAAAQGRSQRVLLYAANAALGVLAAFFNGFLSELRNSSNPENVQLIQSVIQDSITNSDNALNAQDFEFDLQTAGFGWVESNFVTQFLFLNKIGGAFCLLGGAAAGLLAEAELDTRRINAEKIWQEMQRRRLERESRKEFRSNSSSELKLRKKKNKGLSGKERKRIDALTEVVDVMAADSSSKEDAPTNPAAVLVDENVAVMDEEEPLSKKPDGGVGVGVLDTIKGFYERADSLAASQALLLNKKLEDAGVLEKITDETGLNVVGKDKAAAILASASTTSKNTSDTDSDATSTRRD